MSDEKRFERVLIEGTLQCTSPLHIGAGYESEHWVKIKGKEEKALRHHAEHCTDKSGQPYIPASTLRGFLGRALRQIDPAIAQRLIGEAKDEHSGSAGLLRIYDATWAGQQAACEPIEQSRVSIDRITGSSAEHQLYTLKLVPIGSQFKLELELDRVSEAEVFVLLDGLARFDGGGASQLGKNQTLLQGLMHWKQTRRRVLDSDSLCDWLCADAGRSTPKETLESRYVDQQIDPADAPPKAAGLTLKLAFHPASALLVNDQQRVSGEKKAPNLEFTRDQRNGETRLKIPASSLKGLLRARCHKILQTLLERSGGEPPGKRAEAMIGELFGDTGRRGLISMGDALSEPLREPPPDDSQQDDSQYHAQWFNAVDRFTGGVEDGALFNVKAAYTDALEFDLIFPRPALLCENSWAAGLLLLVLRDAMEGDLAIGWGKAKGYGSGHFSITRNGHHHTTWAALWAALSDQERQSAEAAVAVLRQAVNSDRSAA